VQQANYNTLAYATNDPATIALTIRYDNAIQAPLTSGVGQLVGRAFNGVDGIATGIGATL
jgi:hypothetical protein